MINKFFVFLIQVYRMAISPLFGQSKCRFTPTCSQYGLDAYKEFNFFKATYLTLKRVLRCHPLGGYGYDPIPQSSIKSSLEVQHEQ